MTTRVLTIGIIPELVDFSALPGLTAEKVHAGIKAQLEAFKEQGIDAVSCQVDLGETAEQVARAALEASTYDVVVIGAGLRLAPAYHLLFELLINVVHAHAPSAKIAFNTQPSDTLDAIRRWAPKAG